MPGTRIAVILSAALLIGGVAFLPGLLRKEVPVGAQQSEDATLPAVQADKVQRRSMTRIVRLAGTLKSGSRASLSPKQGGRVASVEVRAGQSVRRGQLLARLDTSDIQRQIEQAGAGVTAARAQWRKAADGLKLKRIDYERRVRDARRGVELAQLGLRKAEEGIALQSRAGDAEVARAEAGLSAARNGLARVLAGPTAEQREQVRIQVETAERGEALARKALADVQFLYDRGGVPRNKLDEANEGLRKAQDGVKQARVAQRQLEAGASPEDVEAAKAQIRIAEAALASAKTGADRGKVDEADLAQARAGVRQAEDGLASAQGSRGELDVAQRDVDAARAGLDQAVAAQRLAAQQLEGARIVSPVDGTVTEVNTHAGEMAGPGQPMIVVVGTAGVYLEAAVAGRLVESLQAGQAVTVTVDSQPNTNYEGRIRSVSTVAGPDGRSFPVEVDIVASGGALKAGGLARGAVKAVTYPDALCVPIEALRNSGSHTTVWLVRVGKVVEVQVTVPFQEANLAVVEGDLREGETVVLTSTSGVAPGDRVEISR